LTNNTEQIYSILFVLLEVMDMRILFIAADGVLHPLSAIYGVAPVTPLTGMVQRAWLFRWAWILDELLDGHPDVGIVVHSNWRHFADNDEIQSFLGPLGRRFAGSTPSTQRWHGIASVVESNRLRDFRILDALPEAFPTGLAELIACDPETGLKAYGVRNQIRGWLRTGFEGER
jgi:hypothetical protein